MIRHVAYDLKSKYRKRVEKRNAYICKAFLKMRNEYPVASPTSIMETLGNDKRVSMTRQGVANILKRHNIYPAQTDNKPNE